MQDRPYPQREKVAAHRGVYRRKMAGGVVKYEIGWTDSTGARRWKVVRNETGDLGGLRDAVAAVEEERRKTRRGERTTPATAPRLGEYADGWLDRKRRLRPSTRLLYSTYWRLHIRPKLGRLKVSEVREDDVVGLIRDLEAKGLSSATIAGILVALGGVLNSAVRDGFLSSNPIRRLERDERPSVKSKGKRPLDSSEIESLLAAASPVYSTMLATAIFTGLRCGELLGLKWSDVDFAGGFVRVERQYGRDGEYAELKTEAGRRSVVLAPSLSKLLAEHRLASRFSGPDDPVFASRTGTPLSHRNVTRRGMEAAVKRAGLDSVPGKRTPTLHDCRDTFASMLISRGEDVVFVSRQLGHVRPSVTLDVYADLFDRETHAERARASMESLAGGLLVASLERRDGDGRGTSEVGVEPIPLYAAVSSSGGDR